MVQTMRTQTSGNNPAAGGLGYRLGLIVAYAPAVIFFIAVPAPFIAGKIEDAKKAFEEGMIFGAIGVVVWALVIHGLWRWLFGGYFKDD